MTGTRKDEEGKNLAAQANRRASGRAPGSRRPLRQRRCRRYAARPRHSLHRSQSRRQLSRAARQPRQSPRQRAPHDAAVPARGARGSDRPRLGQGHGPGHGGSGAFQRRPHARDHGRIQRLVRSHAGAADRCDRPGRRRETAALDRLDPHGTRSGRARARLCEVGRPAGLAGGGARGAGARQMDRGDGAAGAGLRQSGRRHAGGGARCAAPSRSTSHA